MTARRLATKILLPFALLGAFAQAAPPAQALGGLCTVNDTTTTVCDFICNTGRTLYVSAKQPASGFLKAQAWCGVEKPHIDNDAEIPGISVICGGLDITTCADETYPVLATSTNGLLLGHCYMRWSTGSATATCGSI